MVSVRAAFSAPWNVLLFVLGVVGFVFAFAHLQVRPGGSWFFILPGVVVFYNVLLAYMDRTNKEGRNVSSFPFVATILFIILLFAGHQGRFLGGSLIWKLLLLVSFFLIDIYTWSVTCTICDVLGISKKR
mgnify:CR=1 FL=1